VRIVSYAARVSGDTGSSVPSSSRTSDVFMSKPRSITARATSIASAGGLEPSTQLIRTRNFAWTASSLSFGKIVLSDFFDTSFGWTLSMLICMPYSPARLSRSIQSFVSRYAFVLRNGTMPFARTYATATSACGFSSDSPPVNVTNTARSRAM